MNTSRKAVHLHQWTSPWTREHQAPHLQTVTCSDVTSVRRGNEKILTLGIKDFLDSQKWEDMFDSPTDEWRWLRNYLMQPVKSENDWEVSQQVKREDLWVGQVEVTKVSAVIAKYVCIVFCFYSPFHACILVLLVKVHPPDPPSTWIHWRSVAPANTVQNTCCSPVSD